MQADSTLVPYTVNSSDEFSSEEEDVPYLLVPPSPSKASRLDLPTNGQSPQDEAGLAIEEKGEEREAEPIQSERGELEEAGAVEAPTAAAEKQGQQQSQLVDTTDLSVMPRKQKYALQEGELNPPMRQFLNEVQKFFTRQVTLERQAPPVAASTYRKARERILCKMN